MQENTLIKVSFITAIVGLFLLIISQNFQTNTPFTISAIDTSLIDKQVTLTGEITKVTKTQEVTIINLKDQTGQIKGVLFSQVNLKTNQKIELQGIVKEYQGALEIQAQKVTIKQ